jgi:aspartate aminotransferase-like enzyme
MTRAGLVALGFTLFAPTAPAAAATAVAVPEGLDSGTVVKELKSRFGAVIANGQGEMKGKIFRIAHLGFFDYMDTIALLGALELIARDTLKLPVQFGQGIAAAQEIFAQKK